MSRLVVATVLLIVVFGLLYDACGEIHRARGRQPRGVGTKLSTPRSTWPPGPHRAPEAPSLAPSCVGSNFVEKEEMGIYNESDNPADFNVTMIWVYAILSAILVGLSGIFPLLIIPLEAGEALKHGAPAARLKLLLSFAVGGLLGDVFLHLLPEAWSHLDADDFHAGHTRIGMWVIVGLLSFLIVEKIFPDDKDDDEESDEAENEKQYTKLSTESDKAYTGQTTSYNLRSRTVTSNDKSYVENGHPQCNGSSHASANGYVKSDDVIQNGIGEKHAQNGNKKSEKNLHIKTSGWLNLLANVIDNFTHGLAVAGSYCCGVKVGFLTTCAILLHEIPHEMGDFAILLRSGFDRWQAAKAQLATAMGGLLGALTALTASSVEQAGNATAWILPFTSGGFIYIALVTVVPDLLKEQNPRESFKQVMLLVLGIVTMALVTLLSE